MNRRLADWECRISEQFWVAVDEIIAEYMGIGTVEGRGWQWTNVIVSCTDMIRHLQGGRRECQDESHIRNPISHPHW